MWVGGGVESRAGALTNALCVRKDVSPSGLHSKYAAYSGRGRKMASLNSRRCSCASGAAVEGGGRETVSSQAG